MQYIKKLFDELNTIMMNKIKCLKLIDALTKLEIKKINDNKILEIKRIKDMIKKSFYEFKEDKEDELKNKIYFRKEQIVLKKKQK